jgi:hypothetical protein
MMATKAAGGPRNLETALCTSPFVNACCCAGECRETVEEVDASDDVDDVVRVGDLKVVPPPMDLLAWIRARIWA